MKLLRRHQGMVTLGLGAGAVSLGSHTDTVRRDAPTCLAMQGPGDQVVLALSHTVPGTAVRRYGGGRSASSRRRAS